ncbi:MAG: RNA polymerase sigma factor, partial [Clostridia bacterium]|nr:RNA polymerase sigma factor [Clostridia bacterium]
MDNGASSYRRFLDGDDNGFVEIVRDYKDGLILFLDSFVRNLSIAEDLAEDTFVKLGIKKPHFSGKSSFKTWLYAIGRNIAVDYIRKESKRSEVSIDECMDLADRQTLEDAYLKEERKIVIHQALGKLKPEYRQVLWLTYFEELSNKET